ncbi:hypothetical protein K438DRAFT_1801603 [Mycena galopus ATCC 62051]|nr:hypothetical protein K438DRAFT_1801603 [Mycena galopus ATCC 62051]
MTVPFSSLPSATPPSHKRKSVRLAPKRNENMSSSSSTLPRADKTSDSTKPFGIDKLRASPQREPISGRRRSYARRCPLRRSPSWTIGTSTLGSSRAAETSASHPPRTLPSRMKSETLTFSATYRGRNEKRPAHPRMSRLAHPNILPNADLDALVGEGAC